MNGFAFGNFEAVKPGLPFSPIVQTLVASVMLLVGSQTIASCIPVMYKTGPVKVETLLEVIEISSPTANVWNNYKRIYC